VLKNNFVPVYKFFLKLDLLSVVFLLFFFQDVIQEILASIFIHIKNFLSDNSINVLSRHIIEQVPVLVVVVLILDSLVWVLDDVGPFLLAAEFLKELGVII
jgi:hypothetical protein